MICRAMGCLNESMPNGPFCGACDEANEESPVRLKPGQRPGKISAETSAKRAATRKANAEAKAARFATLAKNKAEHPIQQDSGGLYIAVDADREPVKRRRNAA